MQRAGAGCKEGGGGGGCLVRIEARWLLREVKIDAFPVAPYVQKM